MVWILAVTPAGGRGLVINASRAVLYAGSGADFAAAARHAAIDLRDQIRDFQHGLPGAPRRP